MDLHVAGWVEQDAIVAPVAPALTPPHDVVTMPPGKLRNPMPAVRTDAALVHPERQQSPFPLRLRSIVTSRRASKYGSQSGSNGLASLRMATCRLIGISAARWRVTRYGFPSRPCISPAKRQLSGPRGGKYLAFLHVGLFLGVAV
jgi:hypothetical protein